jgi:hypothetical protein
MKKSTIGSKMPKGRSASSNARSKSGLLRSRMWSPRSLAALVFALIVGVLGAHQLLHSFAATTNPSGLYWASGADTNSDSTTTAWGNFRGRAAGAALEYTTRNGGWGYITSSCCQITPTDKGFTGDLIISQPFWPEGSGGSLSACASGAYNGQWQIYGTNLKNSGRANVYTRLAWEMNGNWFEWSGTDPAGYVNCFRQVVTAIRSTDPGALIDWTINAHGSQTCGGSAYNCYPGDAYVDVIGIDNYDAFPPSPNQSGWDSQCAGNEGICTLFKFGRSHGKKLSCTEWATWPSNNSGGGDNPLYIQNMYNIFYANRDLLAYETYFDDTGFGTDIEGGTFPNARAKYIALFGANSPAVNRGGSPATPTPTQATPVPAPSLQISQTGNLLTGKAVSSTLGLSSTEPGNPLSNMTDKNESSRWISAPADGGYVQFDLGASYTLSKLSILWAGDTVKDYQVQVSTNASTWTQVATGVTNNTTPQLITSTSFSPAATGRYLRLHLLDRWNTSYGNSIWEMGAYGSPAASIPVATVKPTPGATPTPTTTTTGTTGGSGSVSVPLSPPSTTTIQPAGSTSPIDISVSGGTSVPIPAQAIPTVSGKIVITNSAANQAGSSTTTTVDGVQVDNGGGNSVNLDTNYLPNGDHQVVLSTKNADGSVSSTGRTIKVNNTSNPFAFIRGHLYLAFHGNKVAANTAAVISAVLTLIIIISAVRWYFVAMAKRRRYIP